MEGVNLRQKFEKSSWAMVFIIFLIYELKEAVFSGGYRSEKVRIGIIVISILGIIAGIIYYFFQKKKEDEALYYRKKEEREKEELIDRMKKELEEYRKKEEHERQK